MYVTGGQYKGYKLIIPDCAKPTLSKVRQGVFNVLFSHFGDFSGLIFLDMFSGSGLMGLEALSRGFKTVCVEKNKNAIRIIKENFKIAQSGFEIINKDSLFWAQNCGIKPDVIYVDPPWDLDYEKIFTVISKQFGSTVVVIESDKKRAQELGAIYAKTSAPFKEKVYGRCKVDFIQL